MKDSAVNDQIRMLIEDVAGELGIDSRLIRASAPTRIGSRARDLCWLVAVDALRIRQVDVAAVFGCAPGSIAIALNQRARKLLDTDIETRRIYETAAALFRERSRLALLAELEVMNRTIARYRKRAAVIAGLLGVGGTVTEEQESEAAE